MIRFIATACAVIWASLANGEVAIKVTNSLGGIQAWSVEEPSIPFTALDLIFAGGAALDPDGKRGAAY